MKIVATLMHDDEDDDYTMTMMNKMTIATMDDDGFPSLININGR